MIAGFNGSPAGESIVTVTSPHGEVAGPAGMRSDDNVIARLIAHERIRSGHFDDPARAAERYQLVTEWTSLVAVAVRDAADKADGLPRMVPIAHMLPVGWAGAMVSDGGVVFSLSTGTSAAYAGGQFAAIHRSGSVNRLASFEDHTPLVGERSERHGLRDAVGRKSDLLARLVEFTRRQTLSRRYANAGAPAGFDLLRRAGLPQALLDGLAAGVARGNSEELLVDLLLDAVATLLAHLYDDDLEAIWNSRWAAADPMTHETRQRVKALIDEHLLNPIVESSPTIEIDRRFDIPAFLRRQAG